MKTRTIRRIGPGGAMVLETVVDERPEEDRTAYWVDRFTVLPTLPEGWPEYLARDIMKDVNTVRFPPDYGLPSRVLP